MLLTVVAAVAGNINEEAARQKAAEFLAARNDALALTKLERLSKLEMLTKTEKLTKAEKPAFFVFNVGQDNGFVIVSSSDRTDAILGYSDHGSFDSNDMPDALRAWLDDYRCQIDYLERVVDREVQVDNELKIEMRRAPKSSVAALLASCWDQNKPYNNRCPVFQGEHAATGCVATAMAQLMYYHKYPATSPALPGYESQTPSFGTFKMPALPATVFDWEKMYDGYQSQTDTVEVAKLMRYCGAAVEMQYGTSSEASASDIPVKLKEYFGYDASARFVSRSSYYFDEWAQLIYDELAARRPVLLSGQSVGGGHAFICDGYDAATDMYHINWGWGGRSDGFFRLSLLAPRTQGSGGSVSDDGFNLALSAGIGIRPKTGETPAVSNALTVASLTLDDSYRLTRTGPDKDFFIIPKMKLYNFTGETHTYKFGVRLSYEATEIGTDVWDSEGTSIENNKGKIAAKQFYLGHGLDDGTYRLQAVCQVDDDMDWQLCRLGNENYIELTIAGNELTYNVVKQKTYQLQVDSIIYDHDTLKVGVPEVANIILKNTGEAPYHGDITFLTCWDNYSRKESWGGIAVDIDPDQSLTVKIAHTPRNKGTMKAQVYQGFFETTGTLLAEEDVKIYDAQTTGVQPDLTFSVTVDNASGDKILGTTAKLRLTATNASNHVYRGTIQHVVWKWNGNELSGIATGGVETVPANSTVEIEREVSDLELGGKYSFSTIYEQGDVYMRDDTYAYKPYTAVAAYTFYDNTKSGTTVEATDSISLSEETVCVDLRGQKVVKVVGTYSNPNTVFLVDAGAALPQGVEKNVVKGSVAESLELTDGYDFYCPTYFTARVARYHRIFTNGTDGVSGWKTLMLPFTATQVSVTDTVTGAKREVSWYRNADDRDKDFWLRRPVSGEPGKLTFVHHDSNWVEGGMAFLISVPGDHWGEQYDLTGKEFEFMASDVTVDSEMIIESADSIFHFRGTTVAREVSNAWLMSADGSSFERGDWTVRPFRAYLTLKASGQEMGDTLAIPAVTDGTLPEVSGIVSTTAKASDKAAAVYRLDGTRVNTAARLPRGIYIIRGRKVVK